MFSLAILMPMNRKRVAGIALTISLTLLAAPLFWGCKAASQLPAFRPAEAVLNSCVVAPYTPMALPLHSLANTLEQRGLVIAWEAHGSNFVLRSRKDDHLTGEALLIDFDIQFDGGQGETTASESCGPGRAIITRIQTNDGVHEGLAVDQLLVALAMVTEPPASPTQQDVTGSREVDAVIPKTGEARGTCDVTLEGLTLMSGPCQGLFHEDRVVLSSQQAGGCHVDLRWDGNAAAAIVYSYRNPCLSPVTGESLDADVPLGSVIREGQCWTNEAVRVCLEG
ncbi:hypothetical protein KB221_07505 [Aquidulcibacter paucihalophilus]|nr:hypothetical protein KB221_07505 [Aquidulcibacter paucihalophilus]